ncbi:metal-dependent hydrolase family protein [Acetonema longum]|uniref:Amidohydrolase n=1 Tax=Acetonema longum DSM 6540 TaxID=1009370 RepID=F7NLP4_9FIRM|nr:amidohydrolase family protein [Acetonema longum]EGO62985.1 amidohydrolase [Acetonema longum DSM 6540]
MLIKAGLLIDGTGSAPRQGCYLSLENGKIAAVGREGDFAGLEAEQALDYSAYTILPGLIDVHVHLFLEGISDPKARAGRWQETKEMTLLRAANNAAVTLKNGVTTVRDLAGPGGMSLALKQAVEKKVLTGPRIMTCNRAISITGGHFHYAGGREADGPDEIVKAVREQVKAGAAWIKIMLTGSVNFETGNAGPMEFSFREIQAAVTEAERFNRPVSAHANGVQAVRQALTAGVQSIEHGALLDEAAVDFLRSSPAYWAPTLTPFLQMLHQGHFSPQTQTGLEQVYAHHCAMVRRGIAAGAKIIAGTDAGAPGVQHGEVWRELGLFVELGMSPVQAIASATGLAAKAIGVTDTGVVTAGKNADLLVIDGNPLGDIQSLRHIVQVYKKGVGII